MDCANASGELLPIVQIFEGFGEEIMPKDDYLLLAVPGLSVGLTTDASTNLRKGKPEQAAEGTPCLLLRVA
jgi:hypothetical protein